MAPVALWGHSYGANCAMGAANLTDHVGHLLLYEPSLGLYYPSGWIATYEATVAVGDVEGAIVLMFRDLLEFNDQQIDVMRANRLIPIEGVGAGGGRRGLMGASLPG